MAKLRENNSIYVVIAIINLLLLADIMQKLLTSTKDLDDVIRELSSILDIKNIRVTLSKLNPHASLNRVNKSLEKEYEETNA